MSERIPPQSLDLERCVLGSVLVDTRHIPTALHMITVSAFYNTGHKHIFAAISAMYDGGDEVDTIMLCERLRAKGRLEAVGGEAYIAELTENTATTSNIEQHCRVLFEYQLRREAIERAAAAATHAYDLEKEIGEVVAGVESIGMELAEKCDRGGIGRNSPGKIITVNEMRGSVDTYRESGFTNVGVDPGLAGMADKWRLAKGYMTVVTGMPYHGKALDINTPILTTKGFKKMRDIAPAKYDQYGKYHGDHIYDENGKVTRVLATTEIMYNRPCYEIIFDDGSKIVADEQHQWFTITDKARRSAYESTKKRGTHKKTKPRGTDQRSKKTYPGIVTTKQISKTVFLQKRKKYNHQIPICKPLSGCCFRIPVLPYTLGVWLGDGNCRQGTIVTTDREIIWGILSEGYRVTEHRGKYSYGILGLVTQLKNGNLLKNKHIPKEYFLSEYETRKSLFFGLMDTDGTCMKDRRCEYTTTNKLLAKNVYDLIIGLGFKATMITGNATLNGRIISKKYRICFTANEPAFTIKRKLNRQGLGVKRRKKNNTRTIISCKKVLSRPVKCIQVNSPSHLYLAGRTLIPTHNSEFMEQVMIHTAVTKDWKWGVFSPENFPYIFLFEKLCQKKTGKSFRNELTTEEYEKTMEWMHEHFVMIEPNEDKTTVTDLLRMIRTVKVDGFLIDPWNRLVLDKMYGEGLADATGRHLDRIQWTTRKKHVATCIVAHPKVMEVLQHGKDKGAYPVVKPYDLYGGSMWANKADNILSIYRNFDNNVTQIHIMKVKFKAHGRAPTVMEYLYRDPPGIFVAQQEIDKQNDNSMDF